MGFIVRGLIVAALLAVLPVAVLAQSTEIAFGALSYDKTLPVEVTADRLSVNQADGTAVFSGNVVIGQGEMRISAGEVRIQYGEGDAASGQVERLEASGGVTLVSGAEAAEASEAVYTVASGVIVMTGDVVLTQGRSALSSQKMTVNLQTGTGVLEGGVRTILQPQTAP